MKMTAEEFERAYAERSDLTVERLRALGRTVRPCDCGDDLCDGWQSLRAEGSADYDKLCAADLIERARSAAHEARRRGGNQVIVDYRSKIAN